METIEKQAPELQQECMTQPEPRKEHAWLSPTTQRPPSDRTDSVPADFIGGWSGPIRASCS